MTGDPTKQRDRQPVERHGPSVSSEEQFIPIGYAAPDGQYFLVCVIQADDWPFMSEDPNMRKLTNCSMPFEQALNIAMAVDASISERAGHA